jgi:DNA-binding MarR family transcriptional regulator
MTVANVTNKRERSPLVLEEFLPYRLNRLGMTISEQLRGVYGCKYGLTVPEWRVLATLGEFGRMTAKAVGAHSWMHKTKVSRAVERLAARRLLSRETNPEDRREEFLSLTSAGRTFYGKLIPEMRAFETRLLAELGAGNKRDVLAALTRLEQALGIRQPARTGRTASVRTGRKR